MPTLETRFWIKVDKRSPDECWPWMGALNWGYGVMTAGRRGEGLRPAHRVAYELLVGPIPDGMQIDHLCRNRACVNPAHLEVVTQAENLRRGMGVAALNARKTHCKRGHPFDEANTYFDSRGRRCRTCARAYIRQWKAHVKAARAETDTAWKG